MLGLLAIVTLCVCAHAQSAVESITAQGYPAESHTVTTSDGYILEVVRIPHGVNSTQTNGKVVLLVPGLLASYISFTYLGPSSSIAYNLADAGCDVWILNTRGNMFSRRHKSLDTDRDSMQFFNFSNEEIGLYDVTAAMDHILATTKCGKLHYIGHALGGTVFFILNSLNSAYQPKIASAHLLSAPGYQKEFPNKPVKLLSTAIDVLYSLAQAVQFVEMKPTLALTNVLLTSMVNTSVPQELLGGGAVKQVAHYCQNFRDGSFKRWNYGDAAINTAKYGSSSPPAYDLSKINVVVTLYYSSNDITQSKRDVMDMVRAMPRARAHLVARSDFNHMDYLKSKDVKPLVTAHIIKALKKY